MKSFKFLIISFVLLFTLISPGDAFGQTSLTPAEKAVARAEELARSLKWQISVESNKQLAMPDMILFNNTKSAYKNALAEVSKLPKDKRANYYARLDANVKVHIDRSIAFIDALTGGKKIETLTKELDYLIREEIYMIRMDDAYHEVSAEVRKQAILLYRVYGKSTREAILAKYKKPAEVLKEKVSLFVTAKDIVDAAKAEMQKDEIDIYNMIGYLGDANYYLPKIYPIHARDALQSDIITMARELSEIAEPLFEGPMIAWMNTEDGFKETLSVHFDMGDHIEKEYYTLEKPLEYKGTELISFDFYGFEYTVLLYKDDPNEWISPSIYTLDITEIAE
ncbi:hypothetical protein [Bacillus infantis]|uniref:SbsC C-terminal domain-containing protein n=1 Tax=Bacillus infantis TaxID=324767 RepID=A0A5D4SNJ8_9BACI|nr:hypothetical protein [Bacillus infantis]MCP1160545.1 hypothetical protein [Bacillus infantis]TYS63798.1 hypothetical protein FZD47_09795 [Bacillus infantis]